MSSACESVQNCPQLNVKRGESVLTWPMVSSSPLISASGKEEGKPLIVIIAAMAYAAVKCFSPLAGVGKYQRSVQDRSPSSEPTGGAVA